MEGKIMQKIIEILYNAVCAWLTVIGLACLLWLVLT